MKPLIFFLMLLCAIALPTQAELTDDDLNKIRLIVKEEVKAEIMPIKTELNSLDTRLEKVEQKISNIEGRLDGIDKRISQSNNITYGLIALIIFAIGLPAWQNRRDREEKQKIQELTDRLESLEQHRSVNP